LLDTNIVSQRIKPHPDEKVMRWLSQLPEGDAFLSVVTILELRTGIDLLPAGRKRRDLESWLVADIRRGYAARILPITEEIADICGRLIARGQKEGAIPEANDALFAATAMVHGLQLATLNRRHFERLGVELVEF
jgi:predicted nucleic acid-binding protein